MPFYCFTSPEPIVVPTIKEKVANLSTQQKTGLLNAFIAGNDPLYASRSLNINKNLVKYLFDLFDEIQIKAKAYMRGEITYIASPNTQTDLINLLKPLYSTDLTAAQVTAIVNAMIKWSKFDGTGNFAFYANEIIK